jgi:hypothetical protein
LPEWIKQYEEKGTGYRDINKAHHKLKGDEAVKTILNREAAKDLWKKCMFDKFGEFDSELFHPEATGSGQFIVSKKLIHRNGKDFYEKLYNWLIENSKEGKGSYDDDYSGVITAAYAEYLWNIMFLAPIKN